MTIPIHPPAAWFEHPGEIPTDRRITIQPDGRVYGYVKLRGSCHTGMPGCVDAPDDSPSNFGFAHQGRTMTAEGSEIETAIIAGGSKRHASLDRSTDILRAAAHYQEGVENQLMRVRYGSDANGIWFAGALWPDANELDVEHIRASPNSGDWRFVSYQRQHDFAGAVLVNIPGFAMDNAGGSRSATGNIEAIAASAGFGIDSSGNAFELYAPVEPTVKENQMCEKCDKDKQEPVVASAVLGCECGEKLLCDGKCEAMKAAAGSGEDAPDPVVAAINILNDRIKGLEAVNRDREVAELTAEINNDNE
jgi:hypothetical protein